MSIKQQRLVSLDIMRGITVAGMILVNNSYGNSFSMLKHAEWNGLSVSDFVFPFFLFIMGMSLYLSLGKSGFRFSREVLMKVLKRTFLLFAIGIAINWLDAAVWGNMSLGELRFWAVLQRIALCYMLVALFALCRRPQLTVPLVVSLLIVYTAILIFGNGYSEESDSNILYRADLMMLGQGHLYKWLPVDPEGILSTISALTNTLLGFYCAHRMKNEPGIPDKLVSVFMFGTVLVTLGFLVHFFLPYNKNIWSPSFALVTSGACALLFGVVMKLSDKDRKVGTSGKFFLVFGCNALLLYISSQLMAIIFGRIGFSALIYGCVSSFISIQEFASLAYAITYVLMNFAIGYPLWRKKIFVKL